MAMIIIRFFFMPLSLFLGYVEVFVKKQTQHIVLFFQALFNGLDFL